MKITLLSGVGLRLLVVLGPIAAGAACGPAATRGTGTAAVKTTATPVVAERSSARSGAASAVPLVECSATDFAPSPLTGSTSFSVLEDWPLDGRDASAGSSKENPVMRCGPRDSYAFIAGIYRCADGSNPLDGNVGAGGAARRGNVGPNSQHHIIDLYEVPCPSGAEQVYVDMYGCPEASKRTPSPSALRLNEELPAAVGKLMQEALDLSGDEKYAEAIAKVRDALAQADTTLDPDHPHRARLLDLLGSLQQESEQLDESESSLASAYRIWNSAGWPPIALSGNTCVRLSRVYAAHKQTTLATCVASRGVAYLSDVKGPYDDRVIGSLYLLGELAQESGELELAEKLLRRGVRLAELSRGRRHPLVVSGINKLDAYYEKRGDSASRAALRKRAPSGSANASKI